LNWRERDTFYLRGYNIQREMMEFWNWVMEEEMGRRESILCIVNRLNTTYKMWKRSQYFGFYTSPR
jgi:hypothetical protein